MACTGLFGGKGRYSRNERAKSKDLYIYFLKKRGGGWKEGKRERRSGHHHSWFVDLNSTLTIIQCTQHDFKHLPLSFQYHRIWCDAKGRNSHLQTKKNQAKERHDRTSRHSGWGDRVDQSKFHMSEEGEEDEGSVMKGLRMLRSWLTFWSVSCCWDFKPSHLTNAARSNFSSSDSMVSRYR